MCSITDHAASNWIDRWQGLVSADVDLFSPCLAIAAALSHSTRSTHSGDAPNQSYPFSEAGVPLEGHTKVKVFRNAGYGDYSLAILIAVGAAKQEEEGRTDGETDSQRER